MKISYNWLKEYIDTDLNAGDAAEKLTLLGLEVEELETKGFDFEGLVVGEVLSVTRHPGADKLQLCQVNLGERQVQIVCGADNVASGQKVPVAVTGAVLPSPDGVPLKIKKVKLRGESSEGMICSESELGISDDHSGIMVLDESLEAGTPLSEVLTPTADTVFEIGLTPNRPDAASHIGVARDLAAVLQTDIKNPYTATEPDGGPGEEEAGRMIDIQIDDTQQCPRYTGMVVRNIRIEESPQWLKNRLRSIGLRPINNVVDVTNFVMHEIGQPLHAFDYELLKGGKIVVRHFDTSRTFRTLDNVDREIPAGTLFICDAERPVAVAGIMGGASSEVSNRTRTILIESACFNPSSIRRSSKAIGLQTDASYRYERGTDPNITRAACIRAARLITELAGGEIVEGICDEYPRRIDPMVVPFRLSRLNQLLGTRLEESYAASVLERLEIETSRTADGVLECLIPTFRPDITREIDLIEEVGRIFDYNNIPGPESAPFLSPAPLNSWERMHQRVRQFSTSMKYREIATNSLLSDKEEKLFSRPEEQIRTLNPVSADAATLRTTLLPGFLKALQFNLNRNAKKLRFFEIGHSYRKNTKGTWIEGIEEHSKLLLGVCGYRETENWRTDPEPFTLFDLKEDLESFLLHTGIRERMVTRIHRDPGRLDYLLGEEPVATILRIPADTAAFYDIDLPAFAAEVDLTLLHAAGYGSEDRRYQKVSRYPVFEYDVAYILDQAIPAGKLTDLLRQTAGDQLHSLEVFDVYEGETLKEGKKSIAFRLTFLDRNKTLNIKDVDPIVKNITRVLGKELGAILRS